MSETSLNDLEAKAIRLLAMREHSRSELSHKLQSKAETREQLAQLLNDLEARKLLSDERFTEMYVDQRVRKGYGPLKIRGELEQRGISPELIDLYLDQGVFDWREFLLHVANAKFGEESAGSSKEQGRRARFLQSRGFPPSLVRAYILD